MRLIGLVLAGLGIAYLAGGCAKGKKGFEPPEPQAPETQLTFAPVELDTTTFRVHLFWNGYDSDGEVVRFRFAIDADSARPLGEWNTTTAKDTTLLFLVDPVKELKLHVFKIAAEDNDGKIDLTPASRAFSAKTLPPSSQIKRGPTAFNPTVGPNFTYEWEGIDPDGGETGGKVAVDSFQYQLMLIGTVADTTSPTPPHHRPLPRWEQNSYVALLRAAVADSLPYPYGDWKWKGIRGLKTRFRNATPGEYVFAIRAVDIAGATEKDIIFNRNIRHFSVSNKNPGPALRVCSSILNRCLDIAQGPVDYERKALQVFEGETISFSWSATAETYGGEVVGYTYALDDTSSFPGLDPRALGATFQPSVLPPGSHRLYIRAVDDGGLITTMVVPLLIVHPAFKDPGTQHSILFVDDSTGPGGAPYRIGSFPSDGEETDWWTLSQGGVGPLFSLGVPYTEWDTITLSEGSTEGRLQPDPEHIAPFTTIVWTTDFNNGGSIQTALFKSVAGGNYSELQGYLRAGGTLILTGWNLGQNTSDPANLTDTSAFPGGLCTFTPGSTQFNGSIFPRMYMGIDKAVWSGQSQRRDGANDFLGGIPTAAGIAFGLDSAMVDVGRLATGAKWDTIPIPSANPEIGRAPGLPTIEGWFMAPFFGCQTPGIFRYENQSAPIAQAVYRYRGARKGVNWDGGPSPREGLVCGVFMQSHDLGTGGGGAYLPTAAIGRIVLLGFPLYFVKDPQAINVMARAFEYVNASPTLP